EYIGSLATLPYQFRCSIGVLTCVFSELSTAKRLSAGYFCIEYSRISVRHLAPDARWQKHLRTAIRLPEGCEQDP
ncbi:hypothetical protein, partial [Sodalis-like endosymbiont of Proechinophthirus fluctus]|uniref:hypothetical protein n=1 Tax=Sodalis-like endosymbiont of Proechinophthirus fluctus TaxID=1462730 RepID=UPI00195891B3